jgi:hypothetical protein
MAWKWFKNDWTLAHFLYYISKIGYILTFCYLLLMLLIFLFQLQGDQVGTEKIPLKIELHQFSDTNDWVLESETLSVSENVTTQVNIKATEKSPTSAVIGFHLLTMVEKVLLFVILLLFNKIFKTIIDEEPFSKKNPKYLFIIGWIVFLMPIFYHLIDYIAQPYFAQLALPEGVRILGLAFSGNGSIYVGIFIILLGYVFKEGNRLYQEQKLTV